MHTYTYWKPVLGHSLLRLADIPVSTEPPTENFDLQASLFTWVPSPWPSIYTYLDRDYIYTLDTTQEAIYAITQDDYINHFIEAKAELANILDRDID